MVRDFFTGSADEARPWSVSARLTLVGGAMPSTVTKKMRIEFGDFQTPSSMARLVCRLRSTQNVSPGSIIEPTCGKGSFLFAALAQFPEIKKAVAVDIPELPEAR